MREIFMSTLKCVLDNDRSTARNSDTPIPDSDTLRAQAGLPKGASEPPEVASTSKGFIRLVIFH